MPEPELVQLIDELGKMRAKAIEVTDPEQRENELRPMLISALATCAKLSIARRQADNTGYPDVGAAAAAAAERAGRNGQLAEPVHAISQDYSVEAIDEAIRVAETQL